MSTPSKSGKNWRRQEHEPQAIEALAQTLGVSDLLARLLWCRGLTEPQIAKDFLWPPPLKPDSADRLPNLAPALARIDQARQRGEKVLVHGDYDVDGLTATALMVTALRALSISCDYYIPHRFDEGYGVSPEGLQLARDKNFALVLTVDCGSSAAEEAQLAKTLGLDMIVTDHHTPGESPVECLAHINPKLSDSSYPYPYLAGVGVAYQFARALRRLLPEDEQDQYCESLPVALVTLGTLADVVPLVEENRSLVIAGLEQLRACTQPNLCALMASADIKPAHLNATEIVFGLCPRLNAVGRLGSAKDVVDFLLTSNKKKSEAFAAMMQEANRKRKKMLEELMQTCADQIKSSPATTASPILVVAGDDWHRGVIGIAAARLVDQYHKPAFVISLDEEFGYGSGRAPDGVNLIELLGQCSQHLVKYGGHQGAVGFTLQRASLAEFRQAISLLAVESDPSASASVLWVDAEIGLEQTDQQLLQQLRLLEPCGEGNPKPLFSSNNLQPEMPRVIGNGHLQCHFVVNGIRRKAFGFGFGSRIRELKSPVDVAYYVEEDNYRGANGVRLRLIDLRASTTVAQQPSRETTPAQPTKPPLNRVEPLFPGSSWQVRDHRNAPVARLATGDTQNSCCVVSYSKDLSQQLWNKVIAQHNSAVVLPFQSQFVGCAEPLLSDTVGESFTVVSFEQLEHQPTVTKLVWLVPPLLSLHSQACQNILARNPHPGELVLAFAPELFGKVSQQLAVDFPDRSTLGQVYRLIKTHATTRTNLDTLEPHTTPLISRWGLCWSVAVFEELKLVDYDEQTQTLEAVPAPSKTELASSNIYQLGQEVRARFESFAKEAQTQSLRRIVSRLLPAE